MTIFKSGLKAVLKGLTRVGYFLKLRSEIEYAKGSKKWARTHTIEGHRPLFDITCRHCGSKMLHRYSQTLGKDYLTMGIRDALNIMEYKCPRCRWIALFYVDDSKDYIHEILRRRGGITLYLPPIEQWAGEHEEIKKRLEMLNYI